MRPEISRLVRMTTYPSLEDHPSVLNREHIRGINRDVVFINHNQPESGDDDDATLGTSSKTNLHEAEMVVAIVRYLRQQGYDPGDLVVLTPYLGQLALIQKTLAHTKIGVSLGDQDKAELLRQDVRRNGKKSPSPLRIDFDEGSLSSAGTVRVATIDNYQVS